MSNDVTFRLQVPSLIADRLATVLTPIRDGGLKLATAESCTAGLVASAISATPQLGHVLDCGFVTYSSKAKTQLLGVSPALLDVHGAVSEPVARAMAKGALNRADAAISIAVTGFAGPAGPNDEEGLVYAALAAEGRSTVARVGRFGRAGVDSVRLSALEMIIGLLADFGRSGVQR